MSVTATALESDPRPQALRRWRAKKKKKKILLLRVSFFNFYSLFFLLLELLQGQLTT